MKDKTTDYNSIFASLTNHAHLIQAGIPNEQALKIAFGEEGEKTIADIEKLKKEFPNNLTK